MSTKQHFLNHKNTFRPIWSVTFCESVFIFRCSHMITNLKFRIFIIISWSLLNMCPLCSPASRICHCTYYRTSRASCLVCYHALRASCSICSHFLRASCFLYLPLYVLPYLTCFIAFCTPRTSCIASFIYQ